MISRMRASPSHLSSVLALGLAFVVALPHALGALPADAERLLQTFPGKTISVELVLSRAIASSDSFRALWAQRTATLAPELAAQAPLALTLSAFAQREWNRNQPLSPFDVVRSEQTVAGLGLDKSFATGTRLGVALQQLDFDAQFPDFSSGGLARLQALRSEGRVSLSQSLWRDALGSGTRAGVRSGQLATQAAQAALQESVESWAIGLIDIYYRAWTLQAQVRTAQASLQRRERLARVTAVRERRGTAERPDRLQVSAALSSAQVDALGAQQSLLEVWRGLVTSLKLPEAWLDLNPIEIPMAADVQFESARRRCQSRAQALGSSANAVGYEGSAALKRARLQAEAAGLAFEQRVSELKPDVALSGELLSNAVQRSQFGFGQRWGDALSAQNPRWTVGLNVTLPLDRFAERARAAEASSEREVGEARLAVESSDTRTRWLNLCSDIERWLQSQALYRRSLDAQLERVRLEERRYEQGRSSVTAVIQAGDDASLAELQWAQAQAQLRATAWRLEAIAGSLRSELERWTKAGVTP